jgi:hypothetical protein
MRWWVRRASQGVEGHSGLLLKLSYGLAEGQKAGGK